MKLLLMHTCGAVGSVALADTTHEPPVVHRESLGARTFSEQLVPAVRRALAAAAWGMEALDAVVVVAGPGSFTGVRTGLSVAKGVCEARRIPLIAVSRLALLAGGLATAVLDAGRGEFYVGWYTLGAGTEELTGLDAARHLSGRIVVCEEKVATALADLPGLVRVPEPHAADALQLALARLHAGADDVLSDANYVRWSDADIFARQPGAASG